MNQNLIPVNQNLIPMNQNLIRVNQNLIPMNQNFIPVNQNFIPVNRKGFLINHHLFRVNRGYCRANHNTNGGFSLRIISVSKQNEQILIIISQLNIVIAGNKEKRIFTRINTIFSSKNTDDIFFAGRYENSMAGIRVFCLPVPIATKPGAIR